MLKSQGSPDPEAMVGADARVRGLHGLHQPGPGRPQGDGQHGRPRRRAVPGRDRRRLARRGLAHPRDAAHPHRGRRDDAPRHQRRHGGAAGPARPAGPAGRRPRGTACPARSRRCCAGCRPSRTWPARRRATSSSGGATIKEGQELLLLYPSANRDETVFDDARHVRHHAAAPTRTSPSASAPTSASATSWPAWSSRSCSSGCWPACPTSTSPSGAARCPGARPTSFRASRRCRWRSRRRRPSAAPRPA